PSRPVIKNDVVRREVVRHRGREHRRSWTADLLHREHDVGAIISDRELKTVSVVNLDWNLDEIYRYAWIDHFVDPHLTRFAWAILRKVEAHAVMNLAVRQAVRDCIATGEDIHAIFLLKVDRR